MFNIKFLFKRIKHTLKWLPVIWDDYAYDYSSIYTFIEKKLYFLLSYEDECLKIDQKSLRVAMKLCKRLKGDFSYELRGIERYEKKWGKPEYWTTPTEFDDIHGQLYVWHSRYPKAIFEKDLKQSRIEMSEMWVLSKKIKDRDRRNLFAIMEKYIEGWWV